MVKVIDTWAVLISQTGTEIINIGYAVGYFPGLILTNNLHAIPEKNLEILERHGVIIKSIPLWPTVADYKELISKELITLHGFLRIIPKEFFDIFYGKIYNGHPALILPEYYPELKGKDPQERIWAEKEKYLMCGSVIHEVTPELDAGRIVVSVRVANIARSKEHLYLILSKTSLRTWKHFFEVIWKFK